MVEHATAQFELDVRLKDGCTKREHLASAWRQTGIMPDELKAVPKLPLSIHYLWATFLELHRRRKSNGFGPVPLQYLDVEAWGRLTNRKLDVWELQAILGVDDAYLTVSAKHSKSKGTEDGN